MSRVTLKGLKVCKFASEETTCFEAKVLFDGVYIADARNDGRGGCTDYRARSGSLDTALAQAEAWAASLPAIVTEFDDPKEPGKKFSYASNLEHVIDDLVFAGEQEARLKRLLRKKIIYRDGDTLYQYGTRSGKVDASMIDVVRTKHPGAVILNQIPFAQAAALYAELA